MQRGHPSFSVTAAKEEISKLLDVIAKGSTINIKSRKKIIAQLRPLKSESATYIESCHRIPSTHIKDSKRNVTGVVVHGPYVITRHGVDVAMLSAAPEMETKASIERRLLNALEEQVAQMQESSLFELERQERVKLRQRLDKAIIRRIELLSTKDPQSSEKFRKEFNELGPI